MSKHRLQPPAKNAHWLIHFLHVQLRLCDMTRSELARRAGIHGKTLEAWWAGDAVPNLMNFEAVLMVFDYCLKPAALDDHAKRKQKEFKNAES